MLKVYIVNGGEAYARMFRDAGWATVDNPLEADLLQFTGGEDVTPALYGEGRHRTTGNSVRRDLNEAGYFAFAQRMGIPMAGICRGGQFLNVMSGGKMYQHVGAHATGRTHALFDLKDPMNPRKVVVSSTHHQMMRAGPDGQIIADANLGGFKQFMVGDKVAEGPEDEPDTEVVYYPTTKALCFQPHPEFFGPENECFKYYFECIERVHGLRA